MSGLHMPGIHLAIIMDGNGRWAARRGLPRVAGHRAGVATVRRIVRQAPGAGIRRLTLYAFSCDNWRRPAAEVEGIFRLLRAFLRIEAGRLRQNGVRLQLIGRRDRLPASVLREIDRAERITSEGTRLHLCIAVDYSSRDMMARAAAKLAQNEAFMAESDDVDLLIRTGGEKRLSDFLLWECAYAELWFTDCMWPDFDSAGLDAALEEFGQRERRFGGVPAAA